MSYKEVKGCTTVKKWRELSGKQKKVESTNNQRVKVIITEYLNISNSVNKLQINKNKYLSLKF
jgi:hypothetical protein